MNSFRAQDVVAKLAGVRLQQTVSVMNAMYVLSAEMQNNGDETYAALYSSLGCILNSATVGSATMPLGLRTKPGFLERVACEQMARTIMRHQPEATMRIRTRFRGEQSFPDHTGDERLHLQVTEGMQ